MQVNAQAADLLGLIEFKDAQRVHNSDLVAPEVPLFGREVDEDVRLYLEEARALGLPTHIADAVAALWEHTLTSEGPESDFTSVIKPIEAAAGVTVKGDSEA